jgi:hypothetical protein
MSKWFSANKLALNLDIRNEIKFVMNNSPLHTLSISYKEKYVEESVNTKFLGLQMDNHLNWITHIDQLVPELVVHVMQLGLCYISATLNTLT